MEKIEFFLVFTQLQQEVEKTTKRSPKTSLKFVIGKL